VSGQSLTPLRHAEELAVASGKPATILWTCILQTQTDSAPFTDSREHKSVGCFYKTAAKRELLDTVKARKLVTPRGNKGVALRKR